METQTEKKEVQLYNASITSFNDLARMSDAFWKSGMFEDIKSAAMAMVKIQAGQEVGIKPFAAMTGIHIIHGKPTIGAGIIASRIKASGKYNYEVMVLNNEVCSLDFYEGEKELGNSTFTIEDAKKAGTQNIGKYPKNMLFARAISNGVKWFTPDVFDGPVYVPEEMNMVTEDVTATVKDAEPGTGTKPDAIIDPEKAKEKAQESEPFVIPEIWTKRMGKCESKSDVLKIYKEHKETIDAHPELQNLLKATNNKFNATKTEPANV